MAQIEEEFDVTITWWPFELHPETPAEGRHIDELVAPSRRSDDYRSMLRQYAADAGLTLASNRWVANSHRALELAEFARERGAFQPVHDALFRAAWAEGKNIGDLDVLRDIVAETGLDEREWTTALLTGEYATLVDRATVAARQAGFSSTPTMIFGDKFMIPGAQDIGVYRDVLTRLGATRREPMSEN